MFQNEFNDNNNDLNINDNDNDNIKEPNSSNKETLLIPEIKNRNTVHKYDSSIHVYNPVPLSKLQQAENKYYKIREELNRKYFNNEQENIQNENPEEQNPTNEAKKNKEMISYLEQLNDVLTEILKSSRVQQKEKEKSKKKVQKSPEQIYQEQLKMNDNEEKII